MNATNLKAAHEEIGLLPEEASDRNQSRNIEDPDSMFKKAKSVSRKSHHNSKIEISKTAVLKKQKLDNNSFE